MDITPAQARPASRSSSRKKPKRRWFLGLVALPFAAGGLWVLSSLLVPTLVDWQRMQAWHAGEARLTSAGVDVMRGDDSTSYRARAMYTYEYRGREYEGSRVAIVNGGDNIGDFQQTLGRELAQAHANEQPVPVWINPDDPQEAVLNRDLRWGMVGFYLAFVLVFGGVGFSLLWYVLRSPRDTSGQLGAGDKPWLMRPEWASPRIKSGARFRMRFAWCFAVFWSLIAIPVGFVTMLEFLEGNRQAIFGQLFPLVSIGLVAWAVRETASWRRFGETLLTMDPHPGAIGGQVGGTIDVRLPYDPDLKFRTTLSCLYSRMTGSGKHRRRTERVVWQSEGFAHAQAHLTGTRLDVLFDVDDNLPASDFQDSSDYHLWRLHVQAELPGADFDRSFEIPVFPTAERAGQLRRVSTGHEHAAADRAQAIEKVLEIQQIPGGVELYYPAFRHPGAKVAGIVFGLVFLAVGLFVGYTGDGAVLSVVFVLLGAAIVLLSIYSLLLSLRVRLDHASLETRKRLLGLPAGGQTVPRHEIRGLSLKRSYSSSSGNRHTVYFKLQALTRGGKALTIGYHLAGRETASQALEILSQLTGCPMADKTRA